MTARLAVFILGWLLGGILCGQMIRAEEPLVSKTFPYGAASVEDLKEALPQVLSPRAKMVFVPETRKVIIQDEAANVEAAASIIEELSKVPSGARNVRIEVTLQETGGSREVGVSTRGSGIHVEPIERNALEGGVVDRSSGSSRLVSQMLLVANGRTGTIEVGQDIPMIDYFYQFAVNGGYLTESSIRWQRIGSRLVVSPRIVGNQIEVTVTPEITALANAREQIVRFTRLATTVTIADGSSMQLGGFDGASAEFNRGFFSRGGRSGARVGSFTLKAYIEAVGSSR